MMTDTPSSATSSELSQTTRRWLLGGVAALAVIGGAAVAWRRQETAKPQTSDGPTSGLWSLQLTTPQGSPMALAGLRGGPLLVNFWATWCPPCVDELPLLSGFYQQHHAKGWQVLGIAVDQPDAVNRFLARSPVSFAVAMAGSAGLELSKSLGNLSGGLPFSVVLNSDGEVARRKMGRLTASELAAWSVLT
jgi:thiol-disulfide isomerase/thioredoxin